MTTGLTPLQKAYLLIEKLENRVTELEQEKECSVALVGMDCRFPGQAATPGQFWETLIQGQDTVREVPPERWNNEAIYHEQPGVPGKVYTKYGSFLDNVDEFAADFFEVTPGEARSMDPQHRLLLEVSWHALEHASIVPSSLQKVPTGVFIGIGQNDYIKRTQSLEEISTYSGTGNAFCFAAGRLAHKFGLRGPCLSVDTACSSSLAALHLASQSLRNGECDVAIAGGVQLMFAPEAGVFLCQSRAVTQGNRCRVFDARADGFLRGEGCGVVILKRLSDAMRDGDSILSVIRGSAMNHDGKSSGLTVPNGTAQREVIQAALKSAQVKPEEVSYVEAHGTGTSLGDPIEMEALNEIYGKARSAVGPLTVGSVKANIGHLEAAAGVAGCIKATLAMQHRTIPKQIHFEDPNPHFDWSRGNIQIPDDNVVWNPQKRRLAGVSAFGLSGTNVHLVLEEPPTQKANGNEISRLADTLLLSAKSLEALKQMASAYIQSDVLKGKYSFSEICSEVNRGRELFDHRLAITASSKEEAQKQLEDFFAGDFSQYACVEERVPKIGFIFTGQGAQFTGMGKALYDSQPLFRTVVDQCSNQLKDRLEHPLTSVMFDPRHEHLLHETRYTQPALFALEVALAKLWISIGVEPACIMGHSVGEIAGACISGVFSVEEGVELIAIRAGLIGDLPSGGAMLAVFAAADKIEPFIAQEAEVNVAAYNGPALVVLSGDAQAIERIQVQLKKQKMTSKQLTVSHAFHSSRMDPILDRFQTEIAGFRFRAPSIPLISNVAGKSFTEGVPDAAYWSLHVREPVQFENGIQQIAEACDILLEIGPRPTLTLMGQKAVEQNLTWLNSFDGKAKDGHDFFKALGILALHPIKINWELLYPGVASVMKPELPRYHFERQRYWLDYDLSFSTDTTRIEPAESASIQEVSIVDAKASMRSSLLNLLQSISFVEVKSLEPALMLEADLGLDSIKSIELVTRLSECVPPTLREAFKQGMSQRVLMGLFSVGALVEFMDSWLDSQNDFNHVKSVSIEAVEQTVEVEGVQIDVLYSQLILLTAHLTVSTCSLCSRVRIQSRLDIELLNEAWKQLLERHPVLRSSFISSAKPGARMSDLQLVIRPVMALAPQITIDSLREMDAGAQEERLLGVIQELCSYRWDLHCELLHQFRVYELSDGVFEIVLANHHLVSDGLSNQKMLEELLLIYDGLLCNYTAVLPNKTTLIDYENTVAAMNGYENTQEKEYMVHYLREQGRDSFMWNPRQEDLAKIANRPEPLLAHRLFTLDQDATQRLQATSSQAGASLNSVVLAAYIKTLKFFTPEQQDYIVNVPTSGRLYPDVNPFNMVGCFAQNMALSFQGQNPDESDADFVERTQQAVYQSLASGLDRSQTGDLARSLKNLPCENGTVPAMVKDIFKENIKSNVYLSFIGSCGFEPSYRGLTIQSYHPATTTLSCGIDTLVEIFNDELHLAVNADVNFFGEELIQQFGEKLLEVLAGLSLEAQAPANVVSSTMPDATFRKTIIQIAEESLERVIGSVEFEQDLEGEVGMDSLERIRIITALRQHYPNADRRALMKARSLAQMAAVIVAGNEDMGSDKQTSRVPLEANTLIPDQPIEQDVAQSKADMPYTIIEEQCLNTPHAEAIYADGFSMNYETLRLDTNRLANTLRSLGVGQGDLVAIMAPRKPQMLVGALSILKSGGAYVPVDPTYPAQRVEHILNHSNASILLFMGEDYSLLKKCIHDTSNLKKIICLSEDIPAGEAPVSHVIRHEEWMRASAESVEPISTPDDLMCVLYTSGSTGLPKGVASNHKGYTNRLRWHQKTFPVSVGDRVAHKTSCCFDISVWELFWPLMEGATVCPVVTSIVRDPWELAEWLIETRINIMHFVPSLFGEFLNVMEGENYSFPHLRWLVFSGEILPVTFVQRWIDKYGLATGQANLYGPTEASIDVTAHIIKSRPPASQLRIPIGEPVDNTDILILDENMKPLPAGEKGELWIGGIQLATGYLRDPERTAEAFVKNPLPEIDSPYLYRSGDLAIELPDGSFDYHGRIDSQVKIRGFRVELGEIEAVIAKCSGVKNCAVVVADGKDANKRLIGCVEPYTSLKEAELRSYASDMLPHYMVPHRFEIYETLPVTANGKLDRKFLTKEHSSQQEMAVLAERVPVGPAQRWMLNYFSAPYAWAGFSRFRYVGSLEQERFETAIERLIARHAALRTSFIEEAGAWYQLVHEKLNHQVVEWEEKLQVDPSSVNKYIEQRIDAICQGFALESLPLFKVLVVQTGPKEYELSLIAHHMISDMLSAYIIFDELWKLYKDIDKSLELPDALSYADAIKRLPTAEAELDAIAEQCRSRLEVFEPTWMTKDNVAGQNLISTGTSKVFILSEERSRILMNTARFAFKCSVYHLLSAVLYRYVGLLTEKANVLISHRLHGREIVDGVDHSRSVGNFAVNCPVGVCIDEKAAFVDLVNAVFTALDVLPLNGLGYDLVGEQLGDALYPDDQLTSFRINYLGNRTLPQMEGIHFHEGHSDERYAAPAQIRICELEFIFAIVQGQLELTIEYSKEQYDAETIESMGRNYMSMLEEILKDV